MRKISQSLIRRPPFYAIYALTTDTNINNVSKINNTPQHPSILTIALYFFIAKPCNPPKKPAVIVVKCIS
jgi:hypothetical protein